MNVIFLLYLLVPAAFLMGSIPFGLIYTKGSGVDLRSTGSRNIGATNVTRILGKNWGIFVFALDVLKGFLPLLIAKLNLLRSLNRQVKIKINTVVNRFNHDHNMSGFINSLGPDKWKIFKVLPIAEPESEISDMQFYDFLETHREYSNIMFPEDNDLMTGSYIMIDPLGRFFDNTCREGQKGYRYSKPITKVGAYNAFHETTVDMTKFMARY